MTTQELDRRDRPAQITLLASIAAGVVLASIVAFTAFGGGRGNDGGVPPVASPNPSAPAESPADV